MGLAIQLLLLLIAPGAYVFYGKKAVLLLWRLLKCRDTAIEPPLNVCLHLVTGLLLHLLFILLTGSVYFYVFSRSGLSQLIFWSAVSAPLAVPWLQSWRNCLRGISPIFAFPGINLLLWNTVIIAAGATLFDAVRSGISTPWVNNYGDLAFHLGAITSFTYGANFPPEYPVFAGSPLSYPFFINLWSAALWWPHASFGSLKIIFLYQWVFCWNIIFLCLRNSRLPLLPWALLFAGGSYLYLYNLYNGVYEPNLLAHTFIEKGFPWTPFITTLWVTQRGLLLGMCTLLVSLRILLLEDAAGKETRTAAAAFVLSLSWLAHAHTTIAGAAALGAFVITDAVASQFAAANAALSEIKSRLLTLLRVVALPFLPALLSAIFLAGKTSVVNFKWGWLPGSQAAGSERLTAALTMWWHNAPYLIAAAFFCAFIIRQKRQLLLLALLFAAGNFVQFAVWEWDQLKFFAAVYAAFLVLLAGEQLGLFRSALVNVFLLIFLLPSAVEIWRSLSGLSSYTIYTAQEIERAAELRERVPACAAVIARPDHNSFVTLSGRRLFMGYPGTTVSHGLPSAGREALIKGPFAAFLAGAGAEAAKIKRCCEFVLAYPATIHDLPGYPAWLTGQAPPRRMKGVDRITNWLYRLELTATPAN